MIRLFATDLDDTLLNKQKQIDEHNLLALEKLQQSGVQITVASGRNEVEIERVVKNIPGDYHRVCQNGAFIYLHSSESIYEKYFDPELAHQLYQVGKASGIFCFIATATDMYIAEKNDYIERLTKQVSVHLKYDPTAEQRLGADLLPSKFCYLADDADLKKLANKLHEIFPDQLDTFISTPNCLDVMPKGVHKGNGVRHLADYLGISRDEVACIGDSENDVPMFQVFPHNFVMSVANPHVKAVANRVVSSVAEAVEWVLDYNQNLVLQK
jgi:Cof subfamily protein (haloacid dehalogenase superfamily)